MNNRIDTMSNEEFERLEYEIKDAFHKYNKGVIRLLKRAKSRSNLYMSSPQMLWNDFKRFLSWF